MEDFIRGAIKGMLIVIVPIAAFLALGISSLMVMAEIHCLYSYRPHIMDNSTDYIVP